MTLSYDPAIHDVPLIFKWKDGLDDREIVESFRRDGPAFTSLMVRGARRRLSLAPNRPRNAAREVDGPMPHSKADPLAVAQTHLPGFDLETLTLNGRIVTLIEAMRRTNATLKEKGMEQVAHNPAWVVG